MVKSILQKKNNVNNLKKGKKCQPNELDEFKFKNTNRK